jgi:hypothetical protein
MTYTVGVEPTVSGRGQSNPVTCSLATYRCIRARLTSPTNVPFSRLALPRVDDTAVVNTKVLTRGAPLLSFISLLSDYRLLACQAYTDSLLKVPTPDVGLVSDRHP